MKKHIVICALATAVVTAAVFLPCCKYSFTRYDDIPYTFPADIRFVCATVAPVKYLAQTFWPFNLCIDYVVPTWMDWGWIAAGIVLLAAIVGVCVWWLARPNFWSGVFAFAVAWSYIGLIPMLGIVKVGPEPHSDRYTYWIGCGIASVLFLILLRMRKVWRPYAKKIGYATMILLFAMAIDTRMCASVWKNSKTLFTNVVSKTFSEDFSYLLALELCDSGGDEGAETAEAMLRDVLTVKQTGEAEANLALLLSYKRHKDYLKAGREIEFYADCALAVNPKSGKAWAAKALHAYRTKRYKKALELIECAFQNGYKPQIVEIDLDEWRENAAKGE